MVSAGSTSLLCGPDQPWEAPGRGCPHPLVTQKSDFWKLEAVVLHAEVQNGGPACLLIPLSPTKLLLTRF